MLGLRKTPLIQDKIVTFFQKSEMEGSPNSVDRNNKQENDDSNNYIDNCVDGDNPVGWWFYDERNDEDNNFPDDSVDDKLLFCLGDRDTSLNELLGTFFGRVVLERRKLDNTNWRCLMRSFSAWKWDAVCKIHGQRSEMQRGCFFPHTIFLYFCLKHVVRNGLSDLTTLRSIERWKHQYPPVNPSILPSLPSWVILFVSITTP